MSNKMYDILKWAITVVLPAIGTFYATLGDIWGLPYVEQVPATILAVVTLGSAVLGVSSIHYAKKNTSSK